MSIGDLFFMVCFLALVVAVMRLGVLAVRGRWDGVRRSGSRVAALVVAYFAVLVVVSLATPRRWVALGEEQRFDDLAFAVDRAESAAGHWRLQVRVANHGRGRGQRARDADVALVAADGRSFACTVEPSARPLTSMVQAGESFETAVSVDVPEGATIVGADVIHGSGPPGWFIIGDRGSFLHQRPLVRLGTR
jgi:hypothetical protein